MSQVTVAVVGTGDPDEAKLGDGVAMAYQHAEAYQSISDCKLVACADIVRENAEKFATAFDLPSDAAFEDYREMLETVEPDVISVCTPVPTHADLVFGAAETGIPRAIHCEKPMADNWVDSKRMHEVAVEHDVQLTFNHQRRFSLPWQEAGTLVDDGVIGNLERVEVGGKNLFDFGTHLIDLANHYAGERSAEWVIGQVHYDTEDVRYGAHNENQALATWEYSNGVYGLASTGFGTGADLIGCAHRLIGSDGVLEIGPADTDADLRYRNSRSDGWQSESFESVPLIERAVEHLLECLESGDQPAIGSENALNAAEIIFASWESVRRRARVDLPLEADGNALTELVEDGELTPEPSEQ